MGRRAEGLTGRWADEQTGGQTENMYRLTYIHLNTQICSRTDKLVRRQEGWQSDRLKLILRNMTFVK